MRSPRSWSLPSPLCLVLAFGVVGCGGSGGEAPDAGQTRDAARDRDGGDGADGGAGDAGVQDLGSRDGALEDASARDAGSLEDAGSTELPVRPSAGCGTSGAPTGALANQITRVNGADRSYNAFVPSPYVNTEPHALVFTYHGVGGTANTNQFQFDTYSTSMGARSIQIAPQGWTHPSWDATHFVPFNLEDSLQVFDQVLTHMSNTYCVDLNRVFAMGTSNGGQMAFHLGCLRGDVLRAVLPSGGRCFSSGPGVCDLFHAADAQQCVGDVMVLSVMGADDTTRHADEEATVEGFRARSGCATTTEPREPSPCTRFVGCRANAEVASCRIPGLGHAMWLAGRADMYDYLMSL